MSFSKLSWFKRLRGAGLNDAEFRVLVVLSTYTDKEGNQAFPGNTRLAAECGMQPRSIQRILQRLETKGWISQRHRGGNEYGRGRANVWDLVRTPPTGVIHKGDPTSHKGDPTVHKGDPRSHFKGDPTVTPSGYLDQGIASGPKDHSAPKVAASAEPRRHDWDVIGANMDNLEDYLDEQGLMTDTRAYNLAHQMWENGSHPLAIHNAIAAERYVA